MATLPHNSLPDSIPSQNINGDEPYEAFKTPLSAPTTSTDDQVADTTNYTTEQPSLIDQERLETECSSELQRSGSRFVHIERRIKRFMRRLGRYRNGISMLHTRFLTRRFSEQPRILILDTNDANRLRLFAHALAQADSAHRNFSDTLSQLQAYFGQLDEVGQEADEVCERFRGVNLQRPGGLHELYPHHYRGAYEYWAQRLRNETLTELRSYW